MAHQLDDRAFLTRLDPKGMLRLAEAFPSQCREALRIAQESHIDHALEPKCAMLTGLGGSAAGGDLVRCLFEDQSVTPFLVNRDYLLPKFVGKDWLVFASSYSGNTEETLSAYVGAKARGARLIGLTSGGKLAEALQRDGNGLIKIPAGQPPRTALGFMFIPIVSACVRLGMLPEQPFEQAFKTLETCSALWGPEAAFENNPAKQLAAKLAGAVGILYGLGSWQGAVANRWKGQINENAKNMAFANTFPELNHNEILGWVKADEQNVRTWVTIILASGRESEKMKTRARVTDQLISAVSEVHNATAYGETLLEQMLSLVYMGDFVSLYLAALNGVDPETIDSINILKSELSKVT